MNNLGSIAATQDPILGERGSQTQGRIEIYSFFNGAVQVPTEIETPDWLLTQVLCGHRSDDKSLLISPNLGTADSDYFKPVEKMRIPMTSGASYHLDKKHPDKVSHWSTDEDAVRYWMTRNPQFVEELVKDGWMYFAPQEKVSEERAKKLGLHSHFDRYAARVPLSNLIKVMDRPGAEFDSQVADLKELAKNIGKAGDEMVFVYEGRGGHSSASFVTFVDHNDGSFRLTLGEVNNFLPEHEHIQQNTLRRTLAFYVPFGERGVPHWWNADLSARARDFTMEYATIGKIEARAKIDEGANGLELEVSNRRYGASESNPDTGKLISQAVDLRAFAIKVVGAEHSAYDLTRGQIESARRTALGLVPQVPVV